MEMTLRQFQDDIRAGIPAVLPEPREYDPTVNQIGRASCRERVCLDV